MTQVLGKSVGRIGLGLMGLTIRPIPVEQCLETMKAAVNNGCTFWNGGDFYGTPEWNSMTLLKEYFTKYPEDADKVTIIIKGGLNSKTLQADGGPDAIRASVDNIINQLGGKKKLDIFGIGRRDPNADLGTTLSILQKEYVDTGKIGGISLSEVRADTIHEAVKHVKISALELELSMITPDILDNGVIAAASQHGIPIQAYSPNGRGILAGRFKTHEDVEAYNAMLASFPRFHKEAFDHNLKISKLAQELAAKKGCTPAQLAINWARMQGELPGRAPVIPIPGGTSAARINENSKVIDLTKEELDEIQKMIESFEVVGERYPPFVQINT